MVENRRSSETDKPLQYRPEKQNLQCRRLLQCFSLRWWALAALAGKLAGNEHSARKAFRLACPAMKEDKISQAGKPAGAFKSQ
jgi:hypothetical protein